MSSSFSCAASSDKSKGQTTTSMAKINFFMPKRIQKKRKNDRKRERGKKANKNVNRDLVLKEEGQGLLDCFTFCQKYSVLNLSLLHSLRSSNKDAGQLLSRGHVLRRPNAFVSHSRRA